MNDDPVPTTDPPWPVEPSPFMGYDHDLDIPPDLQILNMTGRVSSLETAVAQLSDDLAYLIDTLQRHSSILENLEAVAREMIRERECPPSSPE